jgi:hypothetical protein
MFKSLRPLLMGYTKMSLTEIGELSEPVYLLLS